MRVGDSADYGNKRFKIVLSDCFLLDCIMYVFNVC